ncbi:MAG: response regulator transcription factor [Anaerovoracaceae bacterium]
MRILVIEDEKALNTILTKKLKSEGYSVDSCFDGEEGLLYALGMEYDVILLDIMLPKLDGVSLLKKIRAKGIEAHVLMLTAKDGIDDKVSALDLGADDYLTKPFELKELMARIRVLTRNRSGNKTNVYQVGDLTLDIQSHVANRGGTNIELSSKEFAILEYLMMNKGIVISREKIENHVWNYDYEGGSNMVDVYIRYIRKKVDTGFEKKLIHTVRGAGYIMREE